MAFDLKMVLAFFLQLMKQIWRIFLKFALGITLKDKIQINVELCKRLDRKLEKTRNIIIDHRGKQSEMSDMQMKVLHELDVVMKRAEDLLQQCMCKGTKSWLYYAVTLTDIKEDVLEIELDLAWWTSMLDMSTVELDTKLDFEEDNAVIKALEQLKTCYDKLSHERKSLQKTAAKDNEHLQSKLEEERLKHAEGTEQHFLTVFLLSRLKDSKGVFDTPDGDIKLLDEHFRRNSKRTKTLGKGAFGVVYAVTWLRHLNFRKLAMKIVFDADKRRPEGKFLQFCNHPHIVRFIWSWEQEHFENSETAENFEKDEKFPHILMEFMPMDLSTLIAQRVKKNEGGPPFEEHEAIDMMLQIAKAVRYLHGKKINIDGTKSKITHRDLKPKNVLVEPCGTRWNVKLTDFGISKVYHGTETKTPLTAKQGTVVYAAPEVWLLEDESNKSTFPPKADVWSFAMTCSEILTGNPPFSKFRKKDLHIKIKEQRLRPDLPSNLPDYVHFCITSCWNLNPQHRPNFLNICRMLNLAKTMSLGILPLDFHTRSLLQLDNPIWQIPHPDVSAPNREVGEKYFLVGTRFRIYVNNSMNEELLNQEQSCQTGIEATEDQYKFLNPISKPIMQGSIWATFLEKFAYGCLIGVFVSSKYETDLKKMKVKFVTGGCIGQTNTTSNEPYKYNCFWGDIKRDRMNNILEVAHFYNMGEFQKGYVYIYFSYGLSNHAIISHLWHDEKLVLGDRNTTNSDSIHRLEWGSKILTDFDRAHDHHSYYFAIISPKQD